MNGMSNLLSTAADTLAESRMLICPNCRTTYSSSRLSICYRDGGRLVDYERFVTVERDPLRGALVGGKYQLLERIGQGGMGTVYRAVQAGLNRHVAVKILKRELNLDPDTVARFQREANAMSLLAHPNTVRVYDFGQTDEGLLYLVMELLVGEVLSEKLLREGQLDVLEALRVTQQILRSLSEAHSQAIVHRDLKPDNVFVARFEGHDEAVVKVLDFGIAKVVAPDRRVDQFETQAGTVFGTPRYMSPEQAQGAPLDGRSDLYTVGTLLYQMLTGAAPFTDDDAVVVMAKHIREVPPPPSETAPLRPIPSSLSSVVMCALEKDPTRRFQDAAGFELALEACVHDVVAMREAALTGRWPRRRSPRSALAYGACALVLFGASYFGVRAFGVAHRPQRSPVAAPLAPGGAATEPVPQTQLIEVVEPAPVKERTVGVAIHSSPNGASVYRDGQRLGQTPLTVDVPEGEQVVRIELRLSGYKPMLAELTARDGTRTLALKPARIKRTRRLPSETVAREPAAPGRRGQAARGTEPASGAARTAGRYERFD